MTVETAAARGPVGTGASRAIAFGGGGEWFVAWMLGYTRGLKEVGVDLGEADVTIGTSAGSIVGTVVKSDHLWRLTHGLEFLGKHPSLANRLLSISDGEPSQKRAMDIIAATTSVDEKSIQEIGRAAMAAKNSPAEEYAEGLHRMLGVKEWPDGHFITAVDCYTGELLIVSKSDDIPLATACAASSSVAGINGPVWLGDRYCMDGGLSTSSTHAEALAGAKVVLILAMFDFQADPPEESPGAFGLSERNDPGTAHREAEALRKQGSSVHVAIANPDPTTDFMDASTILQAMEEGKKRGVEEAEAVGEIWKKA